jgi:hypothetical protein
MLMWTAGHLFGGHNAAFHHFTAYVLKLDGSVADVKVVLEHVIELHQDACTL